MNAFVEFPKIPRLSRECVITEKIDGTNASVHISEDETIRAGSRTRWITPQDDNYGFAAWVEANKTDLLKLGPGAHNGEWWGAGIQRRYGQTEKHFSLFNTSLWGDDALRPACCRVVPIVVQGIFTTELVDRALARLHVEGSLAAPGFMQPEGIVIYHTALDGYFKKTILKDEVPKGKK